MPSKTISVRIDGELIAAQEGQTILEVARANGREIPSLCYLKGLSAIGACPRVRCGVRRNRSPAPGLHHAHAGGHVDRHHDSAKLDLYRRMAVELLLVERNHICSSCVSNGHCELQSLAQDLGITHVRYAYNNPRLPVDMSHPRFVLDHNRCILCTRCVRVCAEVEGAHVWEIGGRGIYSRIVSDLKDDWGAAEELHRLRQVHPGLPDGCASRKRLCGARNREKKSDQVSRLATQRAGHTNGAD